MVGILVRKQSREGVGDMAMSLQVLVSYLILKALLNIVEARFKKLLNYDVLYNDVQPGIQKF